MSGNPIELRRKALKAATPNVLDRLVEYFDPVRGSARRQARYRNAVMNLAGAWSGSLGDRGMRSKAGVIGRSPDEDINGDLDKLRRISRDLYYNNALARGLLRTNTTAIIGTGLRLKARPNRTALGISAETAKAWASQVEREFRYHFDRVECDAERKNNFARLGFMALLQTYLNGESVTVLPRITGRQEFTPYMTGIQLIESDRLCTPSGGATDDTISAGIKFSPFGEPLTYYIAKYHPGDLRKRSSQEWRGIPALGINGRRNVIHFFDQERPQQSRGVPFLSPIITLIKKLGDFTDAELDATVVSSLLTVFVESPDGAELDDLVPDNVPTTGARGADEDIKMAPGAVISLAPGEKVNTLTPGRPNTAFEQFVVAISRQMSSATGVPFEILFKHFTSSYSASRAAFLEAWRYWKQARAWVATGWAQPIYEAWLDEAVAIGRIQAPGYFEDPFVRQAWRGTLWVGDAPGQIDETKQIQAAKARIDARLSSHHRESLELTGDPWEEIAEELAAEMDLIRNNGLVAEPSPSEPPPPDADALDAADQLENNR